VTQTVENKSTKRKAGRPRKLSSHNLETLLELVRDHPLLSLDDLVDAFRKKSGITVCTATVRKYLKAEGLERYRPTQAERRAAGRETAPKTTDSTSRQYGYNSSHRDSGDAVRYPCGLTDTEWKQVQHLFDPAGRPGRPETYPRRQMLDACIYVLRSGCSWRMLPKDFPNWQAVYKTFRRWTARGLFEAMYDELRKLWRAREGRTVDPSASVIDSQSVKTSAQGGPKGFDAGKKVKGRKRHLVTDTLGLLLSVLVTTACVQDRDAAHPAMDLAMAKVPGLKMLYADSGYAGKVRKSLIERHGLDVEIVRHPRNRNVGRWVDPRQQSLFQIPKGFVPLPKRWVVERTNAWNDRPRRMNKDHDRNLSVSTAWIWLTEARMLLRRYVAATQTTPR
jgi:putative transposase